MDRPPDFLWVGNHPATDLCNTQPVIDGTTIDLLPDLEAIGTWAQLAGLATCSDTSRYAEREARRTVRFVHRLRTALRTVLESSAWDGAAVETLNAVLAEQAGAPFVNVTSDPPHRLSWSAPTSAAQLRLDISAGVIDIFRYDAELVRKCTNPACVYLFLDISKSGRRRWCDMATCGNRAKVARHYARNRPT
jgi:predicted RNA-binding Zn ribbon-like protein